LLKCSANRFVNEEIKISTSQIAEKHHRDFVKFVLVVHKELLCSQFFKREYRGGDHMTQGVQKQIGIPRAIEAEAHLVQNRRR